MYFDTLPLIRGLHAWVEDVNELFDDSVRACVRTGLAPAVPELLGEWQAWKPSVPLCRLRQPAPLLALCDGALLRTTVRMVV